MGVSSGSGSSCSWRCTAQRRAVHASGQRLALPLPAPRPPPLTLGLLRQRGLGVEDGEGLHKLAKLNHVVALDVEEREHLREGGGWRSVGHRRSGRRRRRPRCPCSGPLPGVLLLPTALLPAPLLPAAAALLPAAAAAQAACHCWRLPTRSANRLSRLALNSAHMNSSLWIRLSWCSSLESLWYSSRRASTSSRVTAAGGRQVAAAAARRRRRRRRVGQRPARRPALLQMRCGRYDARSAGAAGPPALTVGVCSEGFRGVGVWLGCGVRRLTGGWLRSRGWLGHRRRPAACAAHSAFAAQLANHRVAAGWACLQ